MKRIALTLIAPLLLIVCSALPYGVRADAPTACQRGCKADFQQCVKDTGDRPLCEAGYAFCLECCTGGC